MTEETGATAVPENRNVAFMEAVTLFFKNYVNFQGRSSRGAYWWAFLAMFIISFVLGFIEGMIGSPGIISNLFSLATLLPGIGVGVRRLHDIGKSGWWILIAFTIIAIPLLIYWYCQPGQRSENEFGPDVEAGK
jgi:uncharacterized membrane protein YhaH (DUF805 family)